MYSFYFVRNSRKVIVPRSAYESKDDALDGLDDAKALFGKKLKVEMLWANCFVVAPLKAAVKSMHARIMND